MYLLFLFLNMSIAVHCKLKSVEVFEVLPGPGPAVGPDHGQAGLCGLGPGQAGTGWWWASARSRVTTSS